MTENRYSRKSSADEFWRKRTFQTGTFCTLTPSDLPVNEDPQNAFQGLDFY